MLQDTKTIFSATMTELLRTTTTFAVCPILQNCINEMERADMFKRFSSDIVWFLFREETIKKFDQVFR